MVTGINADDQNILGDWSAPEKDENVTTILEGLKMIAPDTQFDFVDQGWDPRNMDPKKVAEAAARAKSADLNIVVAGEYMMRFRWNDRTDGEDTDRSDIDLVGLQNELIEKVAASGTDYSYFGEWTSSRCAVGGRKSSRYRRSMGTGDVRWSGSSRNSVWSGESVRQIGYYDSS